jgi:GlpG protein
MHWLTITDFHFMDQQLIYSHLLESFYSFEIWRFISPVFMHFNLPHILFNGLWIWVIGRRIEQLQGIGIYLFLFVWASVLSNIAQFWVSGPMFGGLSGVVFAVLAYTWLWDKQARIAFFGFPSALFVFMVFWLVLGYTGLLEAIGFGAIANTAHLAGLIAGLLAVPLVKLIFKRHT